MKLVRDKIPELYPDHQYIKADESTLPVILRLKLAEEIGEVLSAATPDELAGELADVMDVVSALAQAAGVSIDRVYAIRQQKRIDRGGFSEGWVLR